MDRLGKYELRGVLGRGAMGTVYDGWDPHIVRRVAIKTVRLPDSADSEERELLNRFQQEAQAAGRLQHPNVVGVFDYAETDELAYIVMEFVDGRTLKAIMDETRAGGADQPPDLARIGRLMSGMLAGLAYSHAHDVIHRDIKPANIIVTPAGTVKIADFGIARIGGSGMTLAGTIMGTPAYMSPEQFLAVDIDHRTDIYSAGVVLFQLLSGKRPFEGSMATIMQAVLNDPIPRPSARGASVTPALDAVVARAMARSRDDRFADADTFDRALQAALREDAPVAGLPPGLGDLLGEIDETVVRPSVPRPAASAGPARPAALPPPGRSRLIPILAGVAVLVLAAAGAGYALFGRHAPPPVAPTAIATDTTRPVEPPPAQPPTQVPPKQAPPQQLPVPLPPVEPSAPVEPPRPIEPPKAEPPPRADTPPQPTVPLPVPAPPPIPLPIPPIPVPTAIVTAALHLGCSVVTTSPSANGAEILSGIATPEAVDALSRSLDAWRAAKLAFKPDAPVEVKVETARGPYCALLDTVRPYVQSSAIADTALAIGLLDGRTSLVEDELMIPRVVMPKTRGYLQLDYISSTGDVSHITGSIPSNLFPARATPVFGRPGGSAETFPVGSPYGTDLIVGIASASPLFRAQRPPDEKLDAYLRDLRAAIERTERTGAAISASVLLLHTSQK